MKVSTAILISGLAAQQVAAHWDRHASQYNTPQYNNNECSNKQKDGYNWGDLSDGDKPGKYDDFDFGGDWSCSTKFGKRDHLSKRSFGDKCITNKVKKDKPASFGCDKSKKKDGFSVTHIDVSVDHDADLDFHYKMKDGSICKHRASCKKDGTTVKNTQCGGAESVDVYLGHSTEDREDCEIGLHNIGFDCNPPTEYTPPPPYTPAPPQEETPSSSVEVPSSSEIPSSSAEVPSSSSEVPPETTAPPETTESPQPPESTSQAVSTPLTCEGYGPGCGYNSTAPAPPATTPPPPASTPSECGGYNQPSCETATPPPAESSESVEVPSSSEVPATSSAEVPSSSAESSAESSTASPPTPTPPPSEECGGYGQPACEETPSSTPAESVPESSAPPASTQPPSEETPASSQPPSEETPASTPVESSPVSSPPPASTPPSEQCGGYGQPACESAPPKEESSTASPPQPTPSGNGTVPETPATSSPPTYTPPPGGYTPPECLPKCLNTWLKLKTECKDNTDSECYCKVPDLTDNVIDCVKAYGTEEEVQQALSFFVGICAPQVPENPNIIDKCTDVPLAPPTPAPEAPKTSAAAVPEQPTPAPGYPTGAPGQSAPVPEQSTPAPGQPTPAPEQPTPAPGYPTGAPGQSTPAPEQPAAPTPAQPVDIPYTTISYGGNQYTVPQVGFTTEAPTAPGANPTEPIALYPAPSTPAPAPANPTAPYPTGGPSGFTSVAYPTGTGAPIGSTPPEFTGAASSLNIHARGAGVVFGAILAFFAL